MTDTARSTQPVLLVRKGPNVFLAFACICALAGPLSLQARQTITYNDGDNDGTTYVTSDPTTLSIDSGSAIQSGDLSGSGRVIKEGAGALTLTATNTYTGSTRVEGGTLVVTGSIASEVVEVTNSARLSVDGAALSDTAAVSLEGSSNLTLTGAETIGSLFGGSSSLGDDSMSVSLGAHTLTLGSGNKEFYGTVEGTGGVSVTGGAHRLFGINTFKGPITVTGGFLFVNGVQSTDASVSGGRLAGLLSAGTALTISGTGEYRNGNPQTIADSVNQSGGTLSGDRGLTIANNYSLSAGSVTIAGATNPTVTAGSFSMSGGTIASGTSVTSTGAKTLSGGTIAGTLGGAESTTVNGGTVTVSTGSIVGDVTLDSGTLSLGNNNAVTGTVSTTGSVINYAAGITSAAPIDLDSDTTQLQVLTGSATQAGVISETTGPHGFEKIGDGTLTLSGTNTYSGATTLNSGRLNIGNNSALGTGDLIINGGTLSDDGTARTITNNVVANSSFAVESADFSGALDIGGLDIAGPGITIDSIGGSSQADLRVNGAVTGSHGVSYTASQGNFWTVDYEGTAANTLTGTTTVGDQVQLGLFKTGGVNAIAGDLTIDAGGRVRFGGSNQMDDNATLTNNGTFSAGTLGPTIYETIGTLNGWGLVQASGTVILTVSDGKYAGTFSSTSSSPGAVPDFELIKQSPGTLTLSGDSSSTWTVGSAQVNQGTLLINGNVPVPVTVNAGGILGGTGTIGGNTTINNNGTLSPGTSPGTTTFGSDLILNSGSILDYELDTPGTVGSNVNDLAVVNGNLTLDGILNVTDLGSFGAGTYTLITYGGILTNNTVEIGTLPAGYSASIDTSTAGEVRLVVSTNTYTISTNPGTGGSISCTPNPVSHGADSQCTATANSGYSFSGWSGACSGSINPCILSNVTGARTVSATFALLVPAVGLNFSSIDFSSVRVGDSSSTQTVTITNTGTGALTLGSLTISGSQASEFGIDVDNCSGQTLAVDVPCSVSIVFSPTAKDARSAQLNIPSNAASSPDSVSLSGTGIQSEVSISLSPPDFGEVRVGETSDALTVTINNTGTATKNVSALTAAAAPFAQTDAGTCGAAPFSVDAGTFCTLTYTFSPTEAVEATQAFNLTSDAESGSGTFELSGRGVESVVSLSLDTLNFGLLPPGESAQQSLTITNNGEADLNLFEITDPGPPFAVVVGEALGDIQPCTMPSVLEPGESCLVTVEFAPQSARGGSFEASFEIRSDAANSPITVTLRASAEAIPIPIFGRNGLLLLILGMLLAGFLALRPEPLAKLRG